MLILSSCGGINKLKVKDINTENSDISGVYENTEQKYNILKLLDRKLLKDTLTLDKMEGYDKFSILVKDDKNLQIEIIRNDNSKITRQYKYRKKNNIYLLKNQNVKPVLIPYVLGSFDVKKLHLYKNQDNGLGIVESTSRRGAVFLLLYFTWTKSYYEYYTYQRLE